MNFKEQLQVFRTRTDEGLKRLVPLDDNSPSRLIDAMKHSLFAGGKRIRPVILLGVFEANPSDLDPIPAAVALECLHTYSLIHDDLPSMDDSDLRRGQPTCHIAFDEATAVLAGDALLTLAFEIIASSYQSEPAIACQLVMELAKAAGTAGMVGGQMEDIQMEGLTSSGSTTLEDVIRIEDNKTGALFRASIRMGLILSQRPPSLLSIGSGLGTVIGRSFQIVDDILDAAGDEAVVGKTLQTDVRNEKVTAVTKYGLEGAKLKVEELNVEGVVFCKQLGNQVDFLTELLGFLKNRVS